MVFVHPDDDGGPAHTLALAEPTAEDPFGALSGGKGESWAALIESEGNKQNLNTFASRRAGNTAFLVARCLVLLRSRLQRGKFCGGY